MKKVFLTYARENQVLAAAIANDLDSLDYSSWFDRELTGGQAWWDQVLLNIRECDVLIVILTAASLESQACKLEWEYASQLGKHILPVLVADDVDVTLIPPLLANLQHIDRRLDNKQSLIDLLRAMSRLSSTPSLPDPLPSPPRAPMSYLGGMKEQVTSSQDLTRKEQWDLVGRLKVALKDAKNAEAGVQMLRHLQAREDTYAVVSAEIEDILQARTTQSRTSSSAPTQLRSAVPAQMPQIPSTTSPEVTAKAGQPSGPSSTPMPKESETKKGHKQVIGKNEADPTVRTLAATADGVEVEERQRSAAEAIERGRVMDTLREHQYAVEEKELGSWILYEPSGECRRFGSFADLASYAHHVVSGTQ